MRLLPLGQLRQQVILAIAPDRPVRPIQGYERGKAGEIGEAGLAGASIEAGIGDTLGGDGCGGVVIRSPSASGASTFHHCGRSTDRTTTPTRRGLGDAHHLGKSSIGIALLEDRDREMQSNDWSATAGFRRCRGKADVPIETLRFASDPPRSTGRVGVDRGDRVGSSQPSRQQPIERSGAATDVEDRSPGAGAMRSIACGTSPGR